MMNRPVSAAEPIIGACGNGAGDIGFGLSDGGNDFLALRQERRNRGRQRTAGAVRIVRVDARLRQPVPVGAARSSYQQEIVAR